MRCSWSGVFVVMVTPFDAKQQIDESATRALVDHLVLEGVDGIVPAGSTGEWFSMSTSERLRLFEIVADQAAGRVHLLAGTAAIGTGEVLELASEAKKLGYNGQLLLPPPYVIPSKRETKTFIAEVNEVELPIMLYNNPPRTQVNFDADFLIEALEYDQVVALKESSKDIAQLARTIEVHGDEIAVFTGVEPYVLPAATRGAKGVVAMSPNVLGAESVQLFSLAETLSPGLVHLQGRIDRLYQWMYGAGYNPYVILKEGMNLLGRPGGHPRKPLLPMTEPDRRKFLDDLSSGK